MRDHHDDDELVRFRHHPVLGTVVEVRVAGCSPAVARSLDERIVAEMSRLERVLSIHDPSSELERWKRGGVPSPSDDLSQCLTEALEWHRGSGGAFSTSAGFVTALWRSAEQRGEVPTVDERSRAAAKATAPAYEVGRDGRLRIVGDASGIDLNAFAKGWIVDRAVGSVLPLAGGDDGIDVVVSAGGDLRHRGPIPTRVGIENPLRPYDNEPPIATITLHGAALASSGRARRGYRIGGRWFAHVVDPRTGDTVDGIASISIVAPDAATADVMATIAGLMPPADAVAWCESTGSACLVVTADGEQVANASWRSAAAG